MIRKLIPGLLGGFWASAASADWQLNMPKGVTELSAETYDLHMMVFWWCVAIGIVVFGVMIYSLLKHRKSLGVQPATFSHSTSAEVLWTVIPCLILLVMAVPAAKTMVKLEDSRDPDLSVVVTGYQWKWHYKYQDEDIEFYSTLAQDSLSARRKGSGIDPFSVQNYLLDVDNPLVVPRGAKVRILLTSNEMCCMPGGCRSSPSRRTQSPAGSTRPGFGLEVGTYRGQCAELCGKDHGFMPVVVEVVEPDAYMAWVETRKDDATRVAANQ